MPRKRKPKPGAGRWTDGLDPDDVQAALEEATVDAYDEYEQQTGLVTMVEQELAVPFRARVLGEDVDVVAVECPDDDARGLDLVCERGGKRYRIEARSVELLPPLPEGHLYLAAYLAWRSL